MKKITLLLLIAAAPFLARCSDGGKASPADFMNRVEVSRYSADLLTVGVVRPSGSDNWKAVQDLCAARLAELGFEVVLHTYDNGVNVIGRKAGSRSPEKQVILSAHYDGVADCPAVDDNATGVAGALEAARVLSSGHFQNTLIVAFWDQEEWGLIGSRAYAEAAKSRGDDILVAFSYEMLGYRSSEPNSQKFPSAIQYLFPDQYAALQANEFRGDFIVSIHDEHSQTVMDDFAAYAAKVSLPYTGLPLTDDMALSLVLSDLRRSDHAAFWLQGYPGVMLGDTANFRYDCYHCPSPNLMDDGSLLDADFARDVIKATVATVAEALEIDYAASAE